ncbi:MAG TPA: glycosyltransferase family 39 protein, partial [Granulicella sp.]
FALYLWIALVLGFFTLSARQEYYSLPALPALALLIGGMLARADRNLTTEDDRARSSALAWSRWFLIPLCTLLAVAAAFFALTARTAPPGTDIATLLAHSTGSYNLSLSHLSDLTPTAMGLFRGPLALCALALLTIGPVCFSLRRSGHTFTANLTLAAGSTALLLSVHAGLVQFYPTLGSKFLAESILLDQSRHAQLSAPASDLILIDGELTAGSTLLFYTHQPVHLVDGRVNGPWYGSFWPDAPPIFETDSSLHQLWSGPHRLYLLTYQASERAADLSRFAPARVLASSGGKAILTNRP